MKTQHYKMIVLMALVLGMGSVCAGDGNWRGWPVHTLNDVKKNGAPIFIYIKDAATKNNATRALLKLFESDKLLDNEEVKKHLPSMMGAKLSLTDKELGTYLPEWVERAKKQGVLIVVASNDLVKLAIFDGDNKNPQSIGVACAMVLKYQNERKEEAAEKQKKEEAARKEKFASEVKKNKMDAIPGAETNAAPKKEKAKKMGKDGKEAPEEE